MRMRLVILGLAFAFLGASSPTMAARILGVFPFPGTSHFVYIRAVLKTLTSQGHHVVEVSPMPPKEAIPNYTHIKVHSSFEDLMKTWSFEEFMQMIGNSQSLFGFFFLWMILSRVNEEALNDKNIKVLLESNAQFDLVLVESGFGQEPMVLFGHKFQAPVITLSCTSLSSSMNSDAGNSLSMSSIPEFGLAATDQMTFKDRLLNFVTISAQQVLYYWYYLPKQDRLVRRLYRPDAPPLHEMVSNISLYLVNAHPAVDYPRPYTPNIIPIAGITITPERNLLPPEIQKFMDEANDGVIYFSLGTVVPTHLMPKEVLQIFVNVFSKLKQRVLWKIQVDNLQQLPDNVKLAKWLPQPGVLAHKNCVLFLTHGGLLGQQEAMYAGVPTVGIPFMGDQPHNLRVNQHLGIGLKLDFNTLSEETVMKALTTVLHDPKYLKNARRLSAIFKDRPVTAAQTVQFWVEYVLRHKGALHLRPAAARLPWYKRTMVDVVAVLLLTMAVSIYVCVKIPRLIVSKLRRPAQKHVSASKKKS